MNKTLPMLAIVATIALEAAAQPPQAWRVVSVSDGDTVRCLDATNKQVKIRITGIDAPETGQPFGTVARDRLRQLVHGKTVLVRSTGLDKYGRTLATLEVDGRDVGRQMIAEGLAWHYAQFSDDPQLASAQREAQAAGRGLWRDPRPVPPWEWRAGEKQKRSEPVAK